MPKKGYKQSEGHRRKINGMKGKHHSEETKTKMREAKMGKKLSLAHRKKLSEAKEGKIPWNKGLTKDTDERVKKYSEATKGKKNHRWKGGIINNGGYMYVLKHDHPYSDKKGYVKRSNLLMEQHLGRYLEPEEIVHHKNEIRDDDRIENFRLFPTIGKHMNFHNKERNKCRKIASSRI